MSDPVGTSQHSAKYKIGERVQILLDSPFWGNSGWVDGIVVEIQPYSKHRSFFWVRIEGARSGNGDLPSLVSVLNPRKIRKAPEPLAGEDHGTPAR